MASSCADLFPYKHIYSFVLYLKLWMFLMVSDNQSRFILRFVLLSALFLGLAESGSGQDAYLDETPDRLTVIKKYADKVLETGRDQWSGQETPLFIDGVHVDTGDPVVWIHQSGRKYLISNMASQQNLFRVLTGLTNLTGDERYKNAAKEAIQYMFDRFTSPGGLLYWGGHQFVDLRTLQRVRDIDNDAHEFKYHFPYYELMYEVDPEATIQFLRGLWNAHVVDWGVLDMNRHGSWSNSWRGDEWEREFDDPEPFFEGSGLTFLNAGADLIYAAAKLYEFNEEEGALDWAQRLHGMYVKARHPDTGLGAVQYSKPERVNTPPDTGPLPTNQSYGDRAENQFGAVYGDVAREGWVHWTSGSSSIYSITGFMLMGLAEALEGEAGDYFLQTTIDNLTALATHAYIPETNQMKPLWADGTDLTGQSYPRTGYYGDAGTVWRRSSASVGYLLPYARAYRLSNDPQMWEMARNIAQGIGWGDIGSEPGVGVNMDMSTAGNSATELFALLELYRAAPHSDYLAQAEQVADNMIASYYHHGYFLPSEDRVYADFNRLEPLAILALEAVLRGEPEKVPAYQAGRSYIHGTYYNQGRTYDSRVIWSMRKRDYILLHPDAVYPSPGSMINTSRPVISWTEVTSAKEYQFQFTETNFSNIVLDTVVSNSEISLPFRLEAGERYRWRVRALNDTLANPEGYWSSDYQFTVFGVTSSEAHDNMPTVYTLDAAYPNPFNPVTTLRYGLPENSQVQLEVYNLIGQHVATLVNEFQEAGYHQVNFDARNLASGIYLYRLKAGDFIQHRRITLVK